jgi:hypothetical protein
MYNYLSFVQQAEDGAFLFRNKLVAEPRPGSLINLEWWAVGRLSAALGRRPWLAYRLFGAVATLLFLGALAHWLRRAGLPSSHQLAALLLISLGGGLGGPLFHLGLIPATRALDMRTGLFPAIELLVNPHFVIGTALMLVFLAALLEGHRVVAIVVGTLLGLVRPYDIVLGVLIHAGGVAFTSPARDWVRRLLPLLGLAPMAAYNYWVFYRDPAFTFYARTAYLFPPLADFVIAFGPAMALAAVTAWAARVPAEGQRHRIYLIVWVGLAALMIVAHPLHFSGQFLVGSAVPLFALAAVQLAMRPRWILLGLLPVLGISAGTALQRTLGISLHWFVPREHVQLVADLRAFCGPGDVAFAPTNIGQFVGGLTACRPYSSHAIEPAHASRTDALGYFYGAASPSERLRLLEERCVRFVMLPRTDAAPQDSLGPAAHFNEVARSGPLAFYGGPARPGCVPRGE